jgi:flagellar biogenesis protein FliO
MWNQLSLALLPLAEAGETRFGGTEGPDLTRYMTVCIVLIVAIGGLAYGFKRLVAGNLKTRAGKRSLQVLDVLPLGGKQRLAVVRCYDRTFALGLGDKEVTAIAELDPVIGADQQSGDGEPTDEQTFQRALAHVQQALAKTREGVGPRPLRSEAKRQATVAQLLSQVDERAARRAALEHDDAQAAARHELEARDFDRSGAAPRKAKPRKRAVAEPAQPAAPQAQTASESKPRRKVQPSPEPVATLQSLGLEGVMG